MTERRLSILGRMWFPLFRLVGMLPMPVIALLGAAFGLLMRVLLGRRRRVCIRNLELCFPEKTPEEVEKLMRKTFRAVGCGIMGQFVVLSASRNRIKRIVTVEGMSHLGERHERPTILFCPHFSGGIMLSVWASIDHDIAMLYAPQHDLLSEEILRRVRQRFGGKMFRRKRDLFRACNWLKSGKTLSYSPDVDMNSEGGVVFVPFFAVDKTATSTAMPRLAELTHAGVMPSRIEITPTGKFKVTLYPVWDSYPSGDETKDAERMNQVLEQMILEAPEQYFWLHRRFKTRPEGEPGLY